MTIRTWLENIGLAQYTDAFEGNHIDLDLLSDLSDQSLKDLGVSSVGHRVRLLKAIAARATTADSSAADAAPRDGVTSGVTERRQLTILFCDLVGSTQLSQQLDPEPLRDLMQRYRRSCVAIIERYDGYVAQYLGDGLMVYFGYPRAHEDDAERAVRTSLEIITAIKAVAAPEPLRARIGIATGPVVVGAASGSDEGAAKLAVGETPNLAARLQALCKPDEIIVAPATHRLLGGQFEVEDLGPHALKGIVEAVQPHKVIGLARADSRFDARRGAQVSPIIGRDSEVALLADRWARAKSGEGQTVILNAEAGVGKSRLLRALRERIADEPHTTFSFQCSPYHQNSAFHPVIEQIERRAGFTSADLQAEKLAKARQLFVALSQVSDDGTSDLASLLSLQGPTPSPLTPEQQKQRIIDLHVDWILHAAAHQPVMVLLEDAHWADPSTLEVFDALLDRMDAARVLLLVAHRSEFTRTWRSKSRVTALSLTRLSRTEAAALAQRVSQVPLTAEVLDHILNKSDGIPLFVEELTKTAVESRHSTNEDDASTSAKTTVIPSTLRDSLVARLDRIAPVKELLQMGAVIGREFSHRLIASLSGAPTSELNAAMDYLVTSELVFKRDTGGEVVYTFKHALVQDAAYDMILKTTRQQLHAKLANLLSLDANFTTSHPGVLALHFEKAGLFTQAMEWHYQAGKQANLRSAGYEALHHFHSALKLMDEGPVTDAGSDRRVDLNTEIALIYMMQQGWASTHALNHFETAEQGSRSAPGSERRFRAVVGMITTLTWCGRQKDAASHSQELLDLAAASENRIHRLYAHQLHGQSLMFAGKFRLALCELQRASSYYDEEEDTGLTYQFGHDAGLVALNYAAYMQWDTGQLDKSIQSLEAMLALARRIGHPYSCARSLSWLLDLSVRMNLVDRVLQYEEEAIGAARKYAFAHAEALSMFHAGWALAQKGQWDLGIEQMTLALDPNGPLGSGAIITSRLVGQLAAVYGQAGRAEEGLGILEKAPDRQPGRTRVRFADISRTEGELHLMKRVPDPVLAGKLFREAIEFAAADDNKTAQLRAATSLARLLQSQGQLDAAKEVLQPLYESFTEGHGFFVMQDACAVLKSIGALS